MLVGPARTASTPSSCTDCSEVSGSGCDLSMNAGAGLLALPDLAAATAPSVACRPLSRAGREW